jgi:hypothetical protein
MRLLRQTLEGFGLIRGVARGLEGLGQDRRGRSHHCGLAPGEVQDDAEPEECDQDELIDTMMRHQALPPPTWVEMEAFCPVLGGVNYPQSCHTRPAKSPTCFAAALG